MSEWQSIDSAPKNEPIDVYGYNIQGQAAPSGPYHYYFVTVGRLDDYGRCADLLQPETCCTVGAEMEHPTHWRPRPSPPEGPQR